MTVALLGTLVATLAPTAQAARQVVDLAQGSSLTVSCPTTLTGTIVGTQTVLVCAPTAGGAGGGHRLYLSSVGRS